MISVDFSSSFSISDSLARISKHSHEVISKDEVISNCVAGYSSVPSLLSATSGRDPLC